ncbi:MAG: hypothetical protein II852_15795 [Bacteroidales bacterium]|nr:hypothetical protein [Bacteroidales bacterium]
MHPSVKHCILYALLLINFANVNAQESIEDDFLPNSHELSIVWDFKGDIIVRQLAYNYMFNQYLGIGCGLGVWRESEAGSVFSQDFWEEDKGLGRLFIMPKVELSTPNFVKTKKVKINAFVENGIMINRKFTRTIVAWNNEGTDKRDLTFKSKAASYNMMLGIDLEMSDNGGFCIGYSFSTLDYSKKFDYYNTENTLSTENLHGVFLGVYINL